MPRDNLVNAPRLDKKGKRMVVMLIVLALSFYVGFIVVTALGR